MLKALSNYIKNLTDIENALKEKERYKHIMQNASDGIIIHNADHGVEEYNKKAKEMLGYTDEEMLKLKVFDFDTNFSKEKIEEIAKEVNESAVNFETVHKRKDGSLYEASITANKIELEGSTLFYTSIRDISKEKRLQKELHENQQLLNTVIDEMPDLMLVKDERAKYLLANNNVAKLYKTTPEAMIGKEDLDFGVPKEMSDFFKENVLSIMKKGETEIVYEDSIDANTGETRHFKSIKKPFKSADGKDRILVIAQDITEQMEIQERLEIEKNKLYSILQTTRDAFWIVDESGILIDLNPAMEELYGYTREEALGMHITQIEVIDSPEDVKERIERIKELGSAHFETKHYHKGGNIIDSEISTTYIPEQNIFVVFARDITERKRYEDELIHQRGFLRTLVNTIPDLIWLKDPEGKYLACNKRFEDFFGASEAEIVGKTDYDFVDKELADFFREHDKNAMNNDTLTINEEEIPFASDGHKELLQTTKTPMYDGNKNLIGVLGIGHDITQQRKMEEQIRLSEKSFKSLFDSLEEAVYVQDAQGIFLAVNNGAAKMYKRDKEWFIGKTPADVSAPEKNDLEKAQILHQKALEGEPQSFEFWGVRFDGTIFPKEVHQTKGTWFGKDVVFAVALDITERKEHQKQLEHMAHYDALTGLPNRLLFSSRLDQAISQANRHDNILAVAYLDLDGFKEINDLHGHDVGDKLLVSVSHRLQTVLRQEDTLARLGGDEFVAVLVDLEDASSSIPVLERMLEVVKTPVNIDNKILEVSVSIGLTFYEKNNPIDTDQLIRQSDIAMYDAKQSGKNRFHIFDAEYEKILQSKYENIEQIKKALVNDEFVLHYQPKINMRNAQVTGAEALIRWEHPEKGLLFPDTFLPVVNNNILIVEIGDWVIESAMKQIQKWSKERISLEISVNIDALQLQQSDFVAKLRTMLEKYPEAKNNLLDFEILETNALEDIGYIKKIIKECNDLGISFSLDDFGTGYSSLTYLKQLPVKTLKVDRSFVIDMLQDEDDQAIVEGIIELSKTFKREVIAEGVETYEHGLTLLSMGCEHAQGYAIAKPMQAKELLEWINTSDTHKAWVDKA
jgi:diguanylate cyclase (GGDEF)-like protein/PAS domain S-box-containing protein